MKRITKKIITGMLAALLTVTALTPFALSANADETLEQKNVRVATPETSIFMVMDENGQPDSGYAYEYLETLAAYAGWKVEYVKYDSFSDCLKALTNGEVDLFYDVSLTRERESQMLFSDVPMGSEDYYLYCYSETNEFDPGKFRITSGKKAGVTAGTSQNAKLAEWCEGKGIELELVEFGSRAEKERALAGGEIDYDYEVSMLADSNCLAVEKIAGSEIYLVGNIGRADLIQEADSACSKILSIDRSYFTHLNDKYFSQTAVNHTLTSDEMKWVAEHGTLNVGYMNDYLPFCATDEKGNVNGMIRDVIPLMFGKVGLGDAVRLRYTGYDNNGDMYQALQSGEVDVVFPVYGSIAAAKEKNVIFTNSFIGLSLDLAYKGRYSDKTTMSVAVNRNNQLQDFYTRTDYPGSEIVYFDSIEECLDAVDSGRVGMTLLNGMRSSVLLKGYDSIKTLRLPDSVEFRFAVKSGSSRLLSVLNRAIKNTDEASIMTYSYSYVDTDNTYTAEDFLRDNIGLVIAILALIVVLLVLFITTRRRNRRISEANRKISRQKEEISDALQVAETANRAKSDFLFNMSHDIRTPMNAIMGFSQMALKNAGDPDMVADCLGKVRSSGDFLLTLLNDVLDMAKIEQGKLVPEEDEVDLTDLLVSLENMVRENAEERQLKLSFSCDDLTEDTVWADSLHLFRIMMNIISNAIKYTKPGGFVNVSFKEVPDGNTDSGTYVFTVEDNGIGMSQEFVDHIFEQFTRERNTTASGIQGTGLGMAITKSLVDMMNGTITVESELGKGSRFTVTFPLRYYRDKKEPEDSRNVPEYGTVRFDGMRVLLAEDNLLNREIAVDILNDIGIAVEEAEDGSVAVKKVSESAPGYYHLVFMDIQMPYMDGYQATRAIRSLENKELAGIPIYALSANVYPEDKIKSTDAGMNGHLGKPLDMTELIQVLFRHAPEGAGKVISDEKEFMKADLRAPQDPCPYDEKKYTVLIADDSDINRRFLRRMLQDEYNIVDAENGRAALEILRTGEKKIHMVLLDLSMPVMTGFEFMEEWVKDASISSIPVMVQTVGAGSEAEIISLRLGASDFVKRPYQAEVIRRRVANVLKNRYGKQE